MGNCIKEQKNIFKPDKWFGLLIFVTVAAVIIRILFYNHISLDYKACLLPWAKEISRYGGFPSLGHSIGNYNVPYMVFMSMFYYLPGEYLYWLKSFSVIFDFLLAFGAAKIVYLITEDPSKKRIKAIITFSAVIMLPTVLINSAFWGQCDSIYAALAVFSLYFLQKDKLLASSVFFGLSFCFKLQAVFILPVFILVYFSKIRNNQWAKNKIIKFLIIPLIFLIVDLPAIIAGRSIQDVLAIYINQSNQYNVLSYNYSNILFYFNYMPAYMYSFFKYGFLFFTFCIFAAMLCYIWVKRINLNSDAILLLALWSVMVCVNFLPCIHDRYAYIADVLSFVWFIINPKKNRLITAIIINIISMYGYFIFLFTNNTINSMLIVNIFRCVLPAINLGLIICLTVVLVKELKSKSYQKLIRV